MRRTELLVAMLLGAVRRSGEEDRAAGGNVAGGGQAQRRPHKPAANQYVYHGAFKIDSLAAGVTLGAHTARRARLALPGINVGRPTSADQSSHSAPFQAGVSEGGSLMEAPEEEEHASSHHTAAVPVAGDNAASGGEGSNEAAGTAVAVTHDDEGMMQDAVQPPNADAIRSSDADLEEEGCIEAPVLEPGMRLSTAAVAAAGRGVEAALDAARVVGRGVTAPGSSGGKRRSRSGAQAGGVPQHAPPAKPSRRAQGWQPQPPPLPPQQRCIKRPLSPADPRALEMLTQACTPLGPGRDVMGVRMSPLTATGFQVRWRVCIENGVSDDFQLLCMIIMASGSCSRDPVSQKRLCALWTAPAALATRFHLHD